MRFLKLQVLFLLIAVIAVGALAADVVLKNRAESKLEAQITEEVPETTGVRARIRSFPFVGRLLVTGQVSQVDVDVQHSAAGELALSDVRVRVEDVDLDTGEAMNGRAVVRSIKRGTVRADLRQDEINGRLPRQLQVQLQEGKAVIAGPGGTQAQLVVTPEGKIELRIANRSVFELALPTTSLLPCPPTATFVPGALRLSCSFTEVPPLLLERIQR